MGSGAEKSSGDPLRGCGILRCYVIGLTLPARPEESPQHIGACWRQHPADDSRSVIEAEVGRDRVERSARPRLGIVGAVDDSVQPRVDRRARAHRARFKRDSHRAPQQPPSPNLSGGHSHRHDLGMVGGVGGCFSAVGRLAENREAPVDHRADRDFATRCSQPRQSESVGHHSKVHGRAPSRRSPPAPGAWAAHESSEASPSGSRDLRPTVPADTLWAGAITSRRMLPS